MNRRQCMLCAGILAIVLHGSVLQAEQRYEASGMVMSVDRAENTLTISCKEIPGFMDAMVMPFTVLDARSLDPLRPGALIDFTLVVDEKTSHVEGIRVRAYNRAEREPAKSRRLQGLDDDLRAHPHALSIGQLVPDFSLIDQNTRRIRLGQFTGKVVAINFIYTRCILPEYCVRSSNNFAMLQKDFSDRLGKDFILLSITFDPVHDQPNVLQKYAQTWKANPESWHFLTGDTADVQRICDLFGVSAVPEEGLFVHSVHTAIVDRNGKLLANLEGNEFTGRQLADLMQTVLGGQSYREASGKVK